MTEIARDLKARPRFPAFRILHLLLLIVAISLPLAWVVNRIHARRDAVRKILEAGGQVYYDYQWYGGRFHPGARTWIPNWLHRLVGVDAFHNVVWVHVNRPLADTSVMEALTYLNSVEILSLADSQIGDEELKTVGQLHRLKSLSLSRTKVTDNGLTQLQPLTHLLYLFLDGTAVDDAGLKTLGRYTQLVHLDLSGTLITDAGLDHLRPLKNLRFLILNNTLIGDKGLETIRHIGKLHGIGLKNTRVSDHAH